jgi:hypothetical protein
MIENTQRRLRESQFFYRRLLEESRPRMLANEPEALGFYLNALINAARSVPWTLQCEEREKYDAWLPSWEDKLKLRADDRKLLKFTNMQRIAIVKRGGAVTKSEVMTMPIAELRRESRDHPAYGLYIYGMPGTVSPQPSIEWTSLYFEFDGEKIGVMEICERYLDYLERLVQSFIDHWKTTA